MSTAVAKAGIVERPGGPDAPAAPGRGSLGGAWLLSGAMIVSGVLTYAFHILAARALGASAYGEIAVMWGAMFVAAVVLFRPLEQTSSRAIADRRARGQEVASVVRATALLGVVGAGGVLALVATLGWGSLTERLFEGDGFMTAMLLAGVAVYGASYLVRGLLAGVRWFPGYGMNLVSDGLARLLVAAPLVAVASRGLAAAAMVTAGLASAVVPLVVGRRRVRAALAPGDGERFAAREALGFAMPAAVIAAADQLLVNGAPLLVVLEGRGDAHRAAGIVLAATMLARAPVYVFQGVAASLLPNLTEVAATDGSRAVGRAARRVVLGLMSVGLVIAAGAAAIGPAALRMLYGSDFTAGRPELVLIGLGVGSYLVATTFSQALLALDRTRVAALAWSAAAVSFGGLYFALPGGALVRVAIAFAVGTAVVGGLLGLALPRRDSVRGSAATGGVRARDEVATP